MVDNSLVDDSLLRLSQAWKPLLDSWKSKPQPRFAIFWVGKAWHHVLIMGEHIRYGPMWLTILSCCIHCWIMASEIGPNRGRSCYQGDLLQSQGEDIDHHQTKHRNHLGALKARKVGGFFCDLDRQGSTAVIRQGSCDLILSHVPGITGGSGHSVFLNLDH